MKRLFSILLCLSMLLCSAVSCAPASQNDPDDTTLPAETTAPAETEPPLPVIEGGMLGEKGEEGNWWVEGVNTGIRAETSAAIFTISEDGYWSMNGEETKYPASLVHDGLAIHPLTKKTPVIAGEIKIGTGEIVPSDTYCCISGYTLERGHVLALTDGDFIFSVYRYENGIYTEEIRPASVEPYTATEDMMVGILLQKVIGDPLSADSLAEVCIKDTQYNMYRLDGYGHRFTVEAETVKGGTATTRCNVFLPATYSKTGEPTQVVIMTNGHSAYLTDLEWNGNTTENTNVVNSYLSAGFAVCVVNNTADQAGKKTSDLGCPQLVSSYLKAFEYLRENLNVAEQFIVHARSYGTFSGVRIMLEVPELVRCGIMTGPRVSLKSAFLSVSDSNFTAERFGFDNTSGRVYEADKTVGYDPQVDIQSGNYSLPPTYWVMAKGDYTTDPTQFVKDLQALGNDAEMITHDNINHTGICTLNNKKIFNDVLDYINRH